MSEKIRSALFVDFDNIFSSLGYRQSKAAKEFACNPLRWVRWFEEQASWYDDSNFQRKILVRRCYMNPARFGEYRTYFTRAAFSVIDCPSLTGAGKNSADIHMVLDIVDMLEHKTKFGEFIILSTDADFTPVLTRLRSHDRHTAVMADEMTAAAFKSACDHIINLDDFIEHGLGIPESNSCPDAFLQSSQFKSAGIIFASIRQLSQEIDRALATSERITYEWLMTILKNMHGFTGSSWFGTNSMKALIEKVTEIDPTIEAVFAPQGKFESLIRKAKPCVIVTTAKEGPPNGQAAPGRAEDVISYLRNQLSKAPEPILMSKVSQELIRQFGDLAAQGWFGAGTFKSFVVRQHIEDVEILDVPPGYLMCPGRHADSARDLRSRVPANDLNSLRPDLQLFIERISGVTGIPKLSPTAMKAVYDSIARISGHDVEFNDITMYIRDDCKEKSIQVGRANCAFILRAVINRHGDIAKVVLNPSEIAIGVCGAFRDILSGSGLKLSDQEQPLFDEWLGLEAAITLPPLFEVAEDETSAKADPDCGDCQP